MAHLYKPNAEEHYKHPLIKDYQDSPIYQCGEEQASHISIISILTSAT